MSIALSSLNLRRGSAGRNEIEWSMASCFLARRTAPRDKDGLCYKHVTPTGSEDCFLRNLIRFIKEGTEGKQRIKN